MSRIFEITEKIKSYDPDANINLINRAYVFAAQAHAEQHRQSGELYINHPLGVANILASLKLDVDTIATGLLHDTVEDTHVTLEDIRARFGDDVGHLVDGVTKIGKIQFQSSEHKQAENFRKMLLATAKDIRVLLVKLADRLHNMRTLGFVPRRKQVSTSNETMQIYAPLAHRLGIHWIKQEMDDIAFSYLEPEAYQEVLGKLRGNLTFLDKTRSQIEVLLQEALQREKLDATIYGRMKHLFSIHEKIKRKHVDFDQLYDLVAFRVIVKDTAECYHALGIIHSLYPPVPGRFKDYIALPKPNGYQSLQTTVIGPGSHRIEVQIHTQAMHQYAEDGVAAHWIYKSDGVTGEKKKNQQLREFRWLKQLTEMIQDTSNPTEFMENVRLDLFVQEVYVFSRDGDIFALPRGSTPLDFAYAVHTDVGNHCVGVRVNGQLTDFETRLHQGDQVEVLTGPEQTPSLQWLKYIKTPRARQSVRQYFRRQERDMSIRMGASVLDTILDAKPSEKMIKSFKCKDYKQLCEKVGRGDIPVDELISTLGQQRSGPFQLHHAKSAIMYPATCCYPLPGDQVMGALVKGKGMVIHDRYCNTLQQQHENTWMEVEWKPEEGVNFCTAIEIVTKNRRGMLGDISGTIASQKSDIEDLRIEQKAGQMTTLTVLLEVESRKHLADVIRCVRQLEGVERVKRLNHSGLVLKHFHQGVGHMLKGVMDASLHLLQTNRKKNNDSST